MRKLIVAGNWKMNTNLSQGMNFLEEFLGLHHCDPIEKVKVIIFPPFTHLFSFVEKLKNACIQTGAQNIYHEEKGAYTGEISANMVKSIGCQYVLIGHSERRQYFQESNELLAIKTKIAIENELHPIYCCGEVLEEREKGIHFDVIKNQITIGLFQLNSSEFSEIIIAYEPVWAIGTGKTASPEQAEEVHLFIRNLIETKYGSKISQKTTILYGGSVKASNAKELFTQPNIDGALVGGASLVPSEFYQIINSMQ